MPRPVTSSDGLIEGDGFRGASEFDDGIYSRKGEVTMLQGGGKPPPLY